uniref:VWFC domain-containing protein n=1 Tax=Neogobius melanostomus TaxID=47308 RepID=A0A8C6SNR6_9GOBI
MIILLLCCAGKNGNRVFVEGEAFPNPVNTCEECKCENGRTECYRSECPAPQCNAPVSGQCCYNNCNGCSYAGKEYPNGQEFAHPTDKCRTCTCTNGNVQCLKRRCPALHCSNPALQTGECCPRCPGNNNEPTCLNTRFYPSWPDLSDPCAECMCRHGSVHCEKRRCPPANCKHPVQRDCCMSCDGDYRSNIFKP